MGKVLDKSKQASHSASLSGGSYALKQGTVKRVSTKGVFVEIDGKVVVASVAPSCLIAVEKDDLVLSACGEDHRYFVISVLFREGIAHSGVDIATKGDMRFSAEGSLALEGKETLSLRSTKGTVEASAKEAKLAFGSTSLTSNSLFGTLGKVSVFSRAVDLVSDTLHSFSKFSSRKADSIVDQSERSVNKTRIMEQKVDGLIVTDAKTQITNTSVSRFKSKHVMFDNE